MSKRDFHRWINNNLEIVVPAGILTFGAILFHEEIQAYIVGTVFAFISILLFKFLTVKKKTNTSNSS